MNAKTAQPLTIEENTLPIAANLALPLEAVTQTFAILAKRGSGKTYTALVMMEAMLKAGLHTVIVDPVGVCWGLRASADGSGPGLPIIVMGGDHGDVPLEASSGEIIADFVIDEKQSVVLDLSLMRKGEQARFVTDFAERLYQRNRDPLHLLLDEADAFAPQRPIKGQERMLGAIEDIVRRGRARGLGVSLVTQRAAVLNKDVLTQVEVLIALRTIAPQDREAIDAWIKVHGMPEQRDLLMSSLPSLPIGTAWVWSPGWLDLFQQVQVRKRETFDSSATPKVGERRITPRQLAPVDLAALQTRIAATIEQAKEHNPKLLRPRIAELEKKQPALKIERVETKVEVPIFQHGELERLEAALASLREAEASVAQAILGIQAALPATQQAPVLKASVQAVQAQPSKQQTGLAKRQPPQPVQSLKDAVQLRAGERKILEVLSRHYPTKFSRAQLGTLSGYAASGGTFGTYLGTLKRVGYLDEQAGMITLTKAGLAFLGIHQPPKAQTRDAFISMWMEALRAGERKMLSSLLAVYPQALTREELATETEMTASGGTFGTYLGTLRRNGLVVVAGSQVRASDLFAVR